MNKQDLQARIAQISLEMENAIRQHTALSSHLNECNFWLSNFEKLEAENAALVAQEIPELESTAEHLIEAEVI